MAEPLVGLDDEKSGASKEVVTLIMNTKLGDSKQEFLLADLTRIEYFKNRLSGRWQKGESVIISSNDLNFAVSEVELLIFYKQNGAINRKYTAQRLPYFCQALDYFTEKFNEDAFSVFFTKCVPAVTHQQLVSLKASCTKPDCALLLQAIEKWIKRFNNGTNQFHQKLVRNWQTASIKLITSIDYVAAHVFLDQFQTDSPPRWSYHHGQYPNAYHSYEDNEESSRQIKYTAVRNDLHELWAHIVQRKLYLQYPEILTRIYNLKYKEGEKKHRYPYDYKIYPTDIRLDEANALIKIAVDTTEVIFTHKMDNKNFGKMFRNFCELINQSTESSECAGNKWLYALVKPVCGKLLALEKAGFDTFDAIKVPLGYGRKWFEACVRKEEKWITVDVANNFSFEIVTQVCEFILDYIMSEEYQTNGCAPAYIQFIKKHKNIKLNI